MMRRMMVWSFVGLIMMAAWLGLCTKKLAVGKEPDCGLVYAKIMDTEGDGIDGVWLVASDESGEIVAEGITDMSGEVCIELAFGRYTVRVENYEICRHAGDGSVSTDEMIWIMLTEDESVCSFEIHVQEYEGGDILIDELQLVDEIHSREAAADEIWNGYDLNQRIADLKEESSAVFKVMGDIVIDELVTIPAGKYITLIAEEETRSITNARDMGPVFWIEEGAQLTIGDQESETLIFDGLGMLFQPDETGSIWIECRGKLVINNGALIDTVLERMPNQRTGAISVRGPESVFIMNSGQISGMKVNEISASGVDASTCETAPVWVLDGGRFEMHGGEIADNIFRSTDTQDYALMVSGAVGVAGGGQDSVFEMYGGRIVRNVCGTAPVTLDRQSSHSGRAVMRMEDGVISGNTGFYSGGIYIADNPAQNELMMNGGSIIDNQSTYKTLNGPAVLGNGGAVFVNDYGRFTMTGGNLSGNTAARSGSAIAQFGRHSELYISGGSINGNKVLDRYGGLGYGGAVYMDNYAGRSIIVNALISRNRAVLTAGEGGEGGGIWVCPEGNVEMGYFQGVSIFDNIAQYAGDDISSREKETGKQLTLTDRLGTGDPVIWALDGAAERYQPGESTELVHITGLIGEYHLKAIVDEEARTEARKAAAVYIYDNEASYGGGLAMNGSTSLGQTSQLILRKVDNEDYDCGLDGVGFSLYICQEDHEHDLLIDDHYENATDCWRLLIPEVVSDQAGFITPENLSPGSYQLVEIRPAEGYRQPAGQWRIDYDDQNTRVYLIEADPDQGASEVEMHIDKEQHKAWFLLVNEKAPREERPEIHKYVSEQNNYHDSISITEAVTWIIEAEIPDGIGSCSEYLITDQMDSVHQLNGTSLSLWIQTGTNSQRKNRVELYKNQDYEIQIWSQDYPASDSFQIRLSDAGKRKLKAALDQTVGQNHKPVLYISYETVFKKLANSQWEEKLGQALENEVMLLYINESGFCWEQQPVKPEVHIGGIIIKKIDASVKADQLYQAEHLAGAEFKLYTDNNGVPGTALKDPQNPENDWILTAEEDGCIRAYGLAYGKTGQDDAAAGSSDYWLVEIKAPSGYMLMKEPFRITIDPYSHLIENAIAVRNSRYSLPETGRASNGILWFAGVVFIIAGAGIYLAYTKRTLNN